MPKGTTVWINNHAVHHNPDVWEDPEVRGVADLVCTIYSALYGQCMETDNFVKVQPV